MLIQSVNMIWVISSMSVNWEGGGSLSATLRGYKSQEDVTNKSYISTQTFRFAGAGYDPESAPDKFPFEDPATFSTQAVYEALQKLPFFLGSSVS